MLANVFILCFAFAYANCQFVFPGAPGCGCNTPMISPPCNGQVEFLAPVAAPPCGCNAAPAGLPALLQLLLQKGALAAPRAAVPAALLAPAPTAVFPEIVMNSPVTAAPGCGCGLSSCGCNGLCGCGCGAPVGCTNLFLPAASPVSAMFPQVVAPMLPPVCPCQNKCLYLRKVPIPPPSI